MSYNRKNRDRQGGHQNGDLKVSSISYEDWVINPSRVQRHQLKHTMRKVARREYSKAFAEGMTQYFEDIQMDRFDDSHYDDYDPYDHQDYCEDEPDYEDYGEDWDYAPYDDDWDFLDHSYDDDDFRFDRNAFHLQPENEIISRGDSGKTLARLLRERGIDPTRLVSL